MIRLLPIILLTACSVSPDRFADMTPAEFRAYGVDVTDDAERTGTIVNSKYYTLAGVEDRCGENAQGCTVAVEGGFPSASHRYNIYYAEHKCVPYHEAAHAIFEDSRHTVDFNLKWMRGNQLAACP